MGKIILENLEFHAFHGVHPLEKKIGTIFDVTISMKLDLDKASMSDDLHDTIDYGAVYTCVEKEMQIPSYLIEHVAGRIKRVLLKSFPTIEQIEVQIVKKNPPIKGIKKVKVIL